MMNVGDYNDANKYSFMQILNYFSMIESCPEMLCFFIEDFKIFD